jgi:nitroreductase
MIEGLKNRRTVRKYLKKDITDEVLNELLEVACRASNTGNMQLYSMIVTRSDTQKQLLAPAHFNQPMITNAPVVITFCADVNRFVKWCAERNAEPGFDNFQTFMAAVIDSMLVAQTFCNAAEEMGLGICYLGTTTYNADKIIEALKIPRLVVPVTTVTVGYPDGMPDQVERLPLEAMIHNEMYADYTSDDINRLYESKEALADNKKFVLENNKETLAQVFTDVRYTKKNNEFFSETFINVLKEQGFM